MYQKTILDNGLRVITSTMPHTRSVSICVFIGIGSRYETEAQAGISHFIEHLLFKGTQRRASAKEISEAIEGVGGTLNGGTDKELTTYWCKVAKSHFPLALDVLMDMILCSKFNPLDIEAERQVIVEEINMSMDSPSQRVNILIDELLWPNHPLGRDIAGTKESVAVINREAMLSYLTSKYLPVNTVITIAGDIQHDGVVSAVQRVAGSWNNQHAHLGYLAYEEQPVRRLYVETRETKQACLCLGLPGLPLTHLKRFALDLLNIILGGGMSSRLFVEIRDRLGLAYSINSYVEHFLDSGSVTISAGVEPKNLSTVVKAILEQLSKLKQLVPDSELYKAKELSKGRLLLRMEDTRSVASWIGGQEVLTDRILDVDEVISILDAITADDLSQLAQEILMGDQLRLAIVGPVTDDKHLEELLRL